MADMDIKNSAFAFEQTVAGAGDITAILSTANTFVDKNIGIKISTPAAGNLGLSVTDNSGDVTVGEVSDGKYSLTADIAGTVTPASAGWIAASAANVNDSAVVVGKIAQSTLANGETGINSGATVNPAATSQTINITAGYNGARTVIIGPASAGPAGEVTSPDTTATFGAPTYQTTGTNEGKFTIDASGTIAAPTVNEAGYISSTVGTRNAGAISGTKVMDTVTVGVSASSNGAVTPSISKESFTITGVTDAASGSATTTEPTSGVYVKVKSGSTSGSVTATGTVEESGYGTAEHFIADDATTTTVTVNASADTYIPITQAATFTNSIGSVSSSNLSVGAKNSDSYPITANLSIPATISAGTAGWFTSGTATGSASAVAIGSIPEATFSTSGAAVSAATAGYIPQGATVATLSSGAISAVANDPGEGYTENTTAVLAANGWLQLTAGYYGATKISLATLIGDDTDMIPAAAGYSSAVLAGYTAYDDQGNLLAGNIPTYTGAYTIS